MLELLRITLYQIAVFDLTNKIKQIRKLATESIYPLYAAIKRHHHHL